MSETFETSDGTQLRYVDLDLRGAWAPERFNPLLAAALGVAEDLVPAG